MGTTEKVRLLPWYINTRRIALLSGVNFGSAAQQSLNANSSERVDAMYHAARIASQIAKSGKIPNLTREIIERGAPGDRILASIWGVFTFRGLSKALVSEQQGKQGPAPTFSGRIPIGGEEFNFSGELSIDHVYSNTSVTLLSGKRRAFILGHFEFQDGAVRVFPCVIGEFEVDLSDAGLLPSDWPKRSRVYPGMIDAFARIDSVRAPTATQVKSLLNIPEKDVKQAFAEIIGEPFVPKDWGGEKSDLCTSQSKIGGRPLSAAFIFKGPGTRGPMHPATLGKRGDQLVRAFDEPAELIVVQHHNQVTNAVVRQAEALAVDPARPRLYCVIDGADTWKILKAYGKLPV